MLTDYVATRWYRAPEILLGSTKYTKVRGAAGCQCSCHRGLRTTFHLHKSHDDILSLRRFGTDARYTCEMGVHGLQGIDMWSVGCILGEVLGGKAMFQG